MGGYRSDRQSNEHLRHNDITKGKNGGEAKARPGAYEFEPRPSPCLEPECSIKRKK